MTDNDGTSELLDILINQMGHLTEGVVEIKLLIQDQTEVLKEVSVTMKNVSQTLERVSEKIENNAKVAERQATTAERQEANISRLVGVVEALIQRPLQ